MSVSLVKIITPYREVALSSSALDWILAHMAASSVVEFWKNTLREYRASTDFEIDT